MHYSQFLWITTVNFNITSYEYEVDGESRARGDSVANKGDNMRSRGELKRKRFTGEKWSS